MNQPKKRYIQPAISSANFLAARYRLEDGEHPKFLKASLCSLPPVPTPENVELYKAHGLPVELCSSGHNVMQDQALFGVTGTGEFALSPLFVRDLSGRVIYIGYGPEYKADDEWQQNKHVTFPRNCKDVTADTEGAEHIENVFFTLFRTLDVQFQPDVEPSGQPNTRIRAGYEDRNLYPYKLRLDTFYADGWRLPQVEMVYARPVEGGVAEDIGRKFMGRWEHRPQGQKYTDFYTEQDGDTLFEQMFLQGCTVIPTLEACNGFNKVGKNFELEDFWSGRAVEGLHEIVEKRANQAPKGTILEVVEPGYVTAESIKQAKVVVSNGADYQSPHKNTQLPKIPDLRLPHPRVAARWAATWLPTEPQHFEEPALWGWEEETGRFVQFSGPLWDPLHYTYASTAQILKVYRQVSLDGLYQVPEEMKLRFYPVAPLKMYDALSAVTYQQRQQVGSPLQSAVDQVLHMGEVSTVGYHPLPLGYEVELDPFVFPEFAPQERLHDLPVEVLPRLAPVALSKIKPEFAQKVTTTTPESLDLKNADAFRESTGQVLGDYPHLARYVSEDPVTDKQFAMVPLWLENISETELMRNIRRAMGGKKTENVLDKHHSGLYKAFYEFREQSLWWRRLRHRLFRKYPGWYVRCWWGMVDPEIAAEEGRRRPKFGAKQVLERLAKLSHHEKR